MQRRASGMLVLCFGWLLVSMPATSQAAPGMVSGEAALRRLVSDTTWQIKARAGSADWIYWDWHRDHRLCARPPSAGRAEPCADEGTWLIDGDSICWKLTWYGRDPHHFFNTGCVQIQGTNDDWLHLRSRDKNALTGSEFRILTN